MHSGLITSQTPVYKLRRSLDATVDAEMKSQSSSSATMYSPARKQGSQARRSQSLVSHEAHADRDLSASAPHHSASRRGSSSTLFAKVRRRSSASEIIPDDVRSSLFCPRPKKGFFYSRAYREHKKKRKEKQRQRAEMLQGDEGSSVDDDIPLKGDLTRRKRNSFQRGGSLFFAKDKDGEGSNRSLMEPTNVTAYLAARVESERPPVKEVDKHSAALLAPFLGGKAHMMDLTLVGKDGVVVRGSKFVLACYSPLLEEVFFKSRPWPGYDAPSSTLSIDFCTEMELAAAVHHCFSGELPPGYGIASTNEGVARSLAQLDHLAHLCKFQALGEVTYRALRKLINRRAVLACAIFDELSYRDGDGTVDSIKRYALDSMREMPMDTLLGGGVQWMKEAGVEAIMQDQDMDVDEFYMFRVLKAWATAEGKEGEDRLSVAQKLGRHIELKFIDPELLKAEVRESGYFTEKEIAEAIKLIEDSLANRDPCEMERVLVEGAGTDIVNGIYCRVEGEVGMSEEEILFVKEADDGFSDVGLYLWGTKWHIAMCADYSNCFYSCEDPRSKSSAAELVPASGWEIGHGGTDPVPYCTYLPNTRMGRLSNSMEKGVLAPNLEEMMDPTIAEKRRSDYFDKRTDDVIEKRTMTLEQMMNLPEDRC
ncbi:hypothetical protein ACHAXT_001198 [Thalassiosira profunda]